MLGYLKQFTKPACLFLLLAWPFYQQAQEAPEWDNNGNINLALKLGYDSVVVHIYYHDSLFENNSSHKNERPKDTVFFNLLPVKRDTIKIAGNDKLKITRDHAGRIIYSGDSTAVFGGYTTYTYDQEGRLLIKKHCWEKGCIAWKHAYDDKGRLILKTTRTRPDMVTDTFSWAYNQADQLIDYRMYYENKLTGRRRYTYRADGLMHSVIQAGWYYEISPANEVYRMELSYYKRKKK
ncbi:MAG: hypothetical protein FD123_3246 [Bacteroidetes bacterium]|nr:MAG: hypothetical protein FD123_3246 [Bacteroidota bacterium]